MNSQCTFIIFVLLRAHDILQTLLDSEKKRAPTRENSKKEKLEHLSSGMKLTLEDIVHSRLEKVVKFQFI